MSHEGATDPAPLKFRGHEQVGEVPPVLHQHDAREGVTVQVLEMQGAGGRIRPLVEAVADVVQQEYDLGLNLCHPTSE